MDYSGDMWRETPPTEDDDEEEEEEEEGGDSDHINSFSLFYNTLITKSTNTLNLTEYLMAH